MIHKKFCLLLLAVVCLRFGSPLLAQNNSARERMIAAHGAYYTPTASGLKSFRCDATIDWKAMLQRLTGTEIPDENPGLKYLQTVHLSVADELRGRGALEWTTASVPPAGKEETVKQLQAGLQTAVSAFFQSWNAYLNGSMVPLPDSSMTLTQSGDGVHLSEVSRDNQIDEDFDKNMLLSQVLVVSPDFKVLTVPTYANTANGLLLTSLQSQVNRPSAPQTETSFHIDYAKVDSFQIPSRVVLNTKNSGLIEFELNNCQANPGELQQGQ
jgi:hypothetical protein